MSISVRTLEDKSVRMCGRTSAMGKEGGEGVVITVLEVRGDRTG